MQYRLFFMDALRRVTGRDLFTPHMARMNADLALASIAAEKEPGPDDDHQTVVLEPSYGQLDYYSPVLLALAREYRRPLYQHLALWDHSLGALQDTRYVTSHGEQLRFELGGYAYLWYDPEVPAEPGEAPRAFNFPSVEEAYLREGWKPGGLVLGIRKGSAVAHAGGRVVFAELSSGPSAPGLTIRRVADEDSHGVIECGGPDGVSLTAELDRPGRLVLRRRSAGEWTWWCDAGARHEDQNWTWKGDRPVRMTLLSGRILRWEPEGYHPTLAVGNGKLKLRDPSPRRRPLAVLAADASGEIALEVRTG
jgi:hypothetical protein